MDTVRWIISTAPEIFLLLAVAIGTMLGRIKIRGFSIGTHGLHPDRGRSHRAAR